MAPLYGENFKTPQQEKRAASPTAPARLLELKTISTAGLARTGRTSDLTTGLTNGLQT